jgi:hypothetical protein
MSVTGKQPNEDPPIATPFWVKGKHATPSFFFHENFCEKWLVWFVIPLSTTGRFSKDPRLDKIWLATRRSSCGAQTDDVVINYCSDKFYLNYISTTQQVNISIVHRSSDRIGFQFELNWSELKSKTDIKPTLSWSPEGSGDLASQLELYPMTSKWGATGVLMENSTGLDL